jgi:hypothetical protein
LKVALDRFRLAELGFHLPKQFLCLGFFRPGQRVTAAEHDPEEGNKYGDPHGTILHKLAAGGTLNLKMLLAVALGCSFWLGVAVPHPLSLPGW